MTNEHPTYGDFDVFAFHAALDAEREVRGLSWTALARELNRPLARFPGVHPYSSSTLSGMPKRSQTQAKLVMNLLRWLGRTPESFVPGHPDAATAAQIPAHVPRGLGHWDFLALHTAIETQQVERGQTLQETSDQIGVTQVALQRLLEPHKAPGGGLPTVMRMTLWLERPALDFFVWSLPLP